MYVAHNLQTQNIDNQQVNKIIQTSSEISDSINEIVWSLNQEQNSLKDWVMYVRGRTAEMLENAGIEYEFNISEIPEKLLTNQEKRNLYLVVKEAINNAIKHAQATKIEISINLNSLPTAEGWGGAIDIKDNGNGFVENGTPKSGHGNGLKNMQKRMQEIEGSIEWKNGEGTTVKLRLRSAT
jgi:two-component system, NarL family, sensor kinase